MERGREGKQAKGIKGETGGKAAVGAGEEAVQLKESAGHLAGPKPGLCLVTCKKEWTVHY